MTLQFSKPIELCIMKNKFHVSTDSFKNTYNSLCLVFTCTEGDPEIQEGKDTFLGQTKPGLDTKPQQYQASALSNNMRDLCHLAHLPQKSVPVRKIFYEDGTMAVIILVMTILIISVS